MGKAILMLENGTRTQIEIDNAHRLGAIVVQCDPKHPWVVEVFRYCGYQFVGQDRVPIFAQCESDVLDAIPSELLIKD